MKAYNLRQPSKGLVCHFDRGSQDTSKHYRKLLANYGMSASMCDVGACWDNTVVVGVFGNLKHDWLLKVPQPTREHIRNGVTAYVRYYNLERLHTANSELSSVKYNPSS